MIIRVAYIRVSTAEQNTIRQEIIMKELNVEKIFIDKVSGKNLNRVALNEMMNFVRSGDTVIVESISRFARCTKDLLELIDRLNEKEVEFVSIKENIDTTTPTGKFMLTIFGAVAELEREYILSRQREGIEAAKSRGVYAKKRKKDIPNFEKYYKEWRCGEITAVEAMKKMNLSKTTFYRRVAEYEKDKL